MTRTRLFWLLGALVCLYALAFVVFVVPGPQRHSAGTGNAKFSSMAAHATDQRADARPTFAASSPRLVGQAIMDEDHALAGPAPIVSAASTAPEATPQPASIESYALGYELALEREPQDRDWYRRVQNALAPVLASAEFTGARLAGQRCGTNLCRVDLRYDSSQARERAEEALPQREPFNSNGLIRADPADALKVSVYFSRQGHRLPTPQLPGAAL
ncbi:MAG TPA: hypothetical protein VK524_00700 [Polyangiaceae bacterium]|nr:hypothetical protein [Polyangiaceae bacterium]